MGQFGFRALLLRALARAEGETPSLRAVRIDLDGGMVWSGESTAQFELEDGVEPSVTVVAQLLELLVGLIGEALTLQLVRDIWPQLMFNELD